MKCLNCGKDNIGENNFCINCGQSLNKINNIANPIPQENNTNTITTPENNNVEKKKKSKLIKILLIIIPILIIAIVAFYFINKNVEEEQLYYFNNLEIVLNENNIPKFISGEITETEIENDKNVYDVLTELKSLFKFNDPEKEFNIKSIEKNNDMTYYRLEQIYNGIKVYNQNLIISVNKYDKVKTITGEYLPNIEVDVEKKLSKEEIENKLKNSSSSEVQIVTNEEMIYNNKLVYVVEGLYNDKLEELIIDATTGDIIEETQNVNYLNYKYTDKDALNNEVTINLEEYKKLLSNEKNYRFVDTERNISIVDGKNYGMDLKGVISSAILKDINPISGKIIDNKFIYKNESNEENNQVVTNAISNMNLFAKIYDYYKNVLGRNSYDNKNGKIIVNIGLREESFSSEKAMEQATWMSLVKQFYIGEYNGVTLGMATDVVAHEFTHAVIQYTAGFSHKSKEENEAFETGALGEAYGDIMGSLIEGKNFVIADEIGGEEWLGRDLTNPFIYKAPAVKGGDYYFPDYYYKGRTLEEFLKANNWNSLSDYENGGVHHNATVVGHAAYLMYNNKAFNSMEEMAKVWYNSLFYLHPYADFEDCALAVIASAEQLGLSNESINTIKDAFYETKMLEKNKFKIKGKVENIKNSKPIQNVKVTLRNKANTSVVYYKYTDSTGSFYLLDIPEGIYDITFEKKGYNKVINKDIKVDEDKKLEIKLEEQKKTNEKKSFDNMCNSTENKTIDGTNCDDVKCYNLTYNFLEAANSSSESDTLFVERKCTGKIEEGHSLMDYCEADSNAEEICKTIEEMDKYLTETIGETMGSVLGGKTGEFGYYNVKTNQKFYLDTKIYEDTEVEQKIMGMNMDEFVNLYKNITSGIGELNSVLKDYNN